MDYDEMVTEMYDQIGSVDFTSWEIDFIEEMYQLVEDGEDFTESQIEKIEEIWEERMD
jgi:hypothetical protein